MPQFCSTEPQDGFVSTAPRSPARASLETMFQLVSMLLPATKRLKQCFSASNLPPRPVKPAGSRASNSVCDRQFDKSTTEIAGKPSGAVQAPFGFHSRPTKYLILRATSGVIGPQSRGRLGRGAAETSGRPFAGWCFSIGFFFCCTVYGCLLYVHTPAGSADWVLCQCILEP